MIFDEIRAKHPTFGISLYAIVPGEIVTVELITPDKDVFYFAGDTAAEALAKAFPEMVQPSCSNTGLPCVPGCDQKSCAGMHTPLNEWPDPTGKEPAVPAANVFD